ncbi:hypothetical protein V5O48_001534 [Marasmius crinis-equi]|uniref:Uncharacterized protein n=1 Tax=Marasmius crinis-equi TaxID=585013 RepID=A0ABR3FYI0_9AGAR
MSLLVRIKDAFINLPVGGLCLALVLNRLIIKSPTDPPTSTFTLASPPSRTFEEHPGFSSYPAASILAASWLLATISVVSVALHAIVKFARLAIFKTIISFFAILPFCFIVQQNPQVALVLIRGVRLFGSNSVELYIKIHRFWQTDNFWIPYGRCILSNHDWEGFASLHGNSYVTCGHRTYTLRFWTQEEQVAFVEKSYTLVVMIQWAKLLLSALLLFNSYRLFTRSSSRTVLNTFSMLSMPLVACTPPLLLQPIVSAIKHVVACLASLALEQGLPAFLHNALPCIAIDLAVELGPFLLMDILEPSSLRFLFFPFAEKLASWLSSFIIPCVVSLRARLQCARKAFRSTRLTWKMGYASFYQYSWGAVAHLMGVRVLRATGDAAVAQPFFLQDAIPGLLHHKDSLAFEITIFCFCGILTLYSLYAPYHSSAQNRYYVTFTKIVGWEGSFETSLSVARLPKIIINANVINHRNVVVPLVFTTLSISYLCIAHDEENDGFVMYNEIAERTDPEPIFEKDMLHPYGYWTAETF